MSVEVDFQLARFADGFCWQNPQQYADALVANLTGIIGGNFNGVIISGTTPQLTDQGKLWIRVDSSGRPVGQFLFLGAWIWPAVTPPSGQERRLWVGAEADLWAYDGGDGSNPGSSAPTETTGAMWQVDTNFAFKIPMGPGTNSTTYDGGPATTLAVGGTAGEERHTLTGNEALDPSHTHLIGKLDNAGQIDLYMRSVTAVPAQSGTAYRVKGNGSETTQDLSALNKQDVATAGVNAAPTIVSHQNLPPVIGVYFIKRTARIYVTAS